MELESPYLKRGINNKAFRLFLFIACVFPFIIVCLTVTTKYLGHSKSTYVELTEGFAATTQFELTRASVLGFVLSILGMLCIFTTLRNKKVILKLKFDDEHQTLTLYYRHLYRTTIYQTTILYNELQVTTKAHVPDGMMGQYTVLRLIHNKTEAGDIYKGHFTWDAASIERIEKKLGEIVVLEK